MTRLLSTTHTPHATTSGRIATATLAVLMLIVPGPARATAVPAAATPIPARWLALRTNDLRVATMLYRLAIANRQVCSAASAPQPGFALHAIDQYGIADRPQAARLFALGGHIGVMAVVPGSPAALAGLRADDQLISVNGRDLPSPAIDAAAPTNASVEAAPLALRAAMRNGPFTLMVAGRGGVRPVHFTAERGCASSAEVDPGAGGNASADGQRVMIGSGLLDRCTSDDDLALVMAHELAHNILHHPARLVAAGIGTGGNVNAAALAVMRRTEEEADRFAVRLASNAGYDLRGAASFLDGLQIQEGAAAAPATHPAPGRRLALLTAAIDQIGSTSHRTPPAGIILG